MKSTIVFALFIASAYAADLRVNAFYLLEPRSLHNRSAEVCFSLTPAPEKAYAAQVTVDQGYRSQASYNTWIDSRGSACLVVVTRAGKVAVAVPEANLATEKVLQ